jgi:NDP-sugar pyrophosphorylase family protein
MKTNTAVVLAAGLGTRLRPLTLALPKALVRVKGLTVIERLLNSLPFQITRVVIVIGYKGDMIIDYIGYAARDKSIQYVWQEYPDGTFDALLAARQSLKDNFLVLSGDDIYDQRDLEDLISSAPITLLGAEAKTSRGILLMHVTADGYVIGLRKEIEGGERAFLNTGAYLLDERIFGMRPVSIKDGLEYGLPQTLLASGEKIALKVARLWMPVGTLCQRQDAEAYFNDVGVGHLR